MRYADLRGMVRRWIAWIAVAAVAGGCVGTLEDPLGPVDDTGIDEVNVTVDSDHRGHARRGDRRRHV